MSLGVLMKKNALPSQGFSKDCISENNMTGHFVYVISKSGQPLMPTRRFGKVRVLLKKRLAKVVCRKPFTIQLLYDTTNYTQRLVLGVDPGGKDIGIAVRRENGEIVEAAHFQARSHEVSEKMTERKMNRRARRNHRRKRKQRRAKRCKTVLKETKKKFQIKGMQDGLMCNWIRPKLFRFLNRRREKGWQTPTARHLLQFLEGIAQRLPIIEVCLEYAHFDIQKLENPQIQGSEYQSGKQKSYANAQSYVLCRDRHTCQMCEKKQGVLEVHHVIWRSEGGSDRPDNLITLCAKCHEKTHRDPKVNNKVKTLFEGIHKIYMHATLLNSIMPQLHAWLLSRFPKVGITYGYETKEKRCELGLFKKHHIDAYLVSIEDYEKARQIDWKDVLVYEYMQFRRHHRQRIHATRDRNYKDLESGKIVAKNRRKRTGQEEDSLAEYVAKKGLAALSNLRVLPGRKVVRSSFIAFQKGDVVRYKGTYRVVKGYGEMGKRLGFVGEKDYVPTQRCRPVARNKGIVCL